MLDEENLPKPLMKVYEQIEYLLSQAKPEPCCLNAKTVAITAYDHLRCHHYISEADVLVNLLAKPHIKSLLLCHDTVANKAYGPSLPDIPHEVDEDDVCMKIVNLIKNDESLGATIKLNERTGAVLVARVLHNGAADRSNVIDVGDEIQEINGVPIRGRDPMEVIRMLTSISGDVKLKMVPSHNIRRASEQNKPHIRTLFSYSPSADSLIPCPQAGLAFLRGEILRLANTDDPNWWQAVKVEFAPSGPVSSLLTSNAPQAGLGRTGLIPSKALKEWRNQYSASGTNGLEGDSLSYEEVERYFPEEGCYRPIVLVGPSGVGKTELVQQLISTDPEHFREPIRITTRDPRPGEVHGVDYLFVTRDEFETFVEADSLIDQSEASKDEMTGLCIDAVLEIIQAGQVAVFEADYRNLPQIRTATLKPLIVFVKPPSLDVLIETRQLATSPRPTNASLCSPQSSPARSVPTTPRLNSVNRPNRTLGSTGRPRSDVRHRSDEQLRLVGSSTASSSVTDLLSKNKLTETQLQDMLKTASRMEVTHGHLCDYILVNDDLPVALEQLSELAYRMETEALWIPRHWIQSASDTQSTNDANPATATVSVEVDRK